MKRFIEGEDFTAAKMQRRMAQIEESIARYLADMDTADQSSASALSDFVRTSLTHAIWSYRLDAESFLTRGAP